MVMLSALKSRIGDDECYRPAFGNSQTVIDATRTMFGRVYAAFVCNHSSRDREVYARVDKLRVEDMGRHTDYGGGKTISSASSRCFASVSALRDDDTVHMVDANPAFGEDEFRLSTEIEIPAIGTGNWRLYPRIGYKRLLRDLKMAGYSRKLRGVDVAFMGNGPFGGGMSASSAGVMRDFYVLAGPNGLLEDPEFRELIIENGRRAGMDLDTDRVDPFYLALSMYLSCFENGKPFGDLKGGMGVGTFGGSLDHTSSTLCTEDQLMVARYCPTEILEFLDWPERLAHIVFYTGKPAEKTGGARGLYNFASKRGSLCVDVFNAATGREYTLMRELPDGPWAIGNVLVPVKTVRDIAGVLGVSEAVVRERYAVPEGVKDCGLANRLVQFSWENHYIGQFARAIRGMANPLKEERAMGELANAMNMSHQLSRDKLWVISPEVNGAQGACMKAGALCSSGFGAGGGGSAIAYVDRSNGDVDDFMEDAGASFEESCPELAGRYEIFEDPPSAASMRMFED